jgi:hypothetical protein
MFLLLLLLLLTLLLVLLPLNLVSIVGCAVLTSLGVVCHDALFLNTTGSSVARNAPEICSLRRRSPVIHCFAPAIDAGWPGRGTRLGAEHEGAATRRAAGAHHPNHSQREGSQHKGTTTRGDVVEER